MSLKERLIKQIRMDGPIPVSAYMQTCLHDRKDGYYANGAGLGRDFITAPETSQLFGELLGLWIAEEYQSFGAPDSFNLIEMGPGRATLMADALRSAARFIPATALQLSLIEASPALRDVQSAKLAAYHPCFKDTLEQIPPGTSLIIANEFLDCLPARQFVREADTWRERIIGLNEAGDLSFGIDRSDLRAEAAAIMTRLHLQAEAELQPGLNGLVDALQYRARMGDRFHALFIDYGPANGTPGDSLRAYKDGRQVDPLACPGEADLTVDVDFGRLVKQALASGLQVCGPVTQSAFLGALGLQERLDTLIQANPDKAETLFAGAQKLVDPAQMGTRFKVICLSSPGLPVPAGFL